MQFFWSNYCNQNFVFQEFWLILSRVAPYYSSLARTVWSVQAQMYIYLTNYL